MESVDEKPHLKNSIGDSKMDTNCDADEDTNKKSESSKITEIAGLEVGSSISTVSPIGLSAIKESKVSSNDKNFPEKLNEKGKYVLFQLLDYLKVLKTIWHFVCLRNFGGCQLR